MAQWRNIVDRGKLVGHVVPTQENGVVSTDFWADTGACLIAPSSPSCHRLVVFDTILRCSFFVPPD